jgi:hypothetical protein
MTGTFSRVVLFCLTLFLLCNYQGAFTRVRTVQYLFVSNLPSCGI